MNIEFGPRGVVMIDDAMITLRNFRGEENEYNDKGKRNFSLIIPDENIANMLMEDKNKYGVGWNVKIREPKNPGDKPTMYLKVNVRFDNFPPDIFLISDGEVIEINENNAHRLDEIDIASVNLDIRPYDGISKGRDKAPFRTAYVKNMEIIQDVNRFRAKYKGVRRVEEPEDMFFDEDE